APLDRGSQREAKAKVRLGHFTLEDHLPALQRESLHVSLGKLQFLLRAPLASVRRGGRIGLRCEATAEALQKEGPVRELEDAPGGIPVLEPCVPAGARLIADRALRCRLEKTVLVRPNRAKLAGNLIRARASNARTDCGRGRGESPQATPPE